MDNSDAVKDKYIRGINLIKNNSSYFLFNAHGDVVHLTDSAGAVTKRYHYDAFGNEVSPSASDGNPWRYCGEYWDLETNTLYLRNRNYNPTIGRFLSEDTHWNPQNMIYGDNPVKWNEREQDDKDPLGVNTYTYKPDLSAIMQSGNLYAYCMNNPLAFVDPTGNIGTPISWAMTVIFGVAGGFFGNYLADKMDLHGWKRGLFIGAVSVGGAALGFFAGEVLVGFTKAFLFANPTVLMNLPAPILSLLGISGSAYAVIGSYPAYSNFAQSIGACFFSLPTAIWNTMNEAQQWATNQKFLDDMIRQGKEFLCSNNAYEAVKGTGFWKEIDYLLRNGYKIIDDGFRLIKK